MIAPHFVAKILEFLLERPDPEQTCRATFLAARCLGEVRKRNELGAIVDRVLDHVKALVGFDLVPTTYHATKTVRESSLFARDAVRIVVRIWRDAPDTGAWLKERALADEEGWVRRTAVVELAHGWKEDRETLRS